LVFSALNNCSSVAAVGCAAANPDINNRRAKIFFILSRLLLNPKVLNSPY
jgi:hypothetical protein